MPLKNIKKHVNNPEMAIRRRAMCLSIVVRNGEPPKTIPAAKIVDAARTCDVFFSGGGELNFK